MTNDRKVETHPVQRSSAHGIGRCPVCVTAAAYEVYSHIFRPQPELANGGRGGFGVNELIAFLYARSFPRQEWKDRVDEAFAGMENI